MNRYTISDFVKADIVKKYNQPIKPTLRYAKHSLSLILYTKLEIWNKEAEFEEGKKLVEENDLFPDVLFLQYLLAALR